MSHRPGTTQVSPSGRSDLREASADLRVTVPYKGNRHALPASPSWKPIELE